MFYIFKIIIFFIPVYSASNIFDRITTLEKIFNQANADALFKNITGVVNTNNEYCKLCCVTISSDPIKKVCGKHTMCIYSENQTGPACRGYIPVPFSPLEKQALVEIHNVYRNRVALGREVKGRPGPQPSAANMRYMEWSSELATFSERWAAQCVYSNDFCRDTEFFPVGQNLAHGNLATNNDLKFITQWYEEVTWFNNREVPRLERHRTVHPSGSYVQIVWADTYLLGCARAIFQQSQSSEVFYRQHLICNYGPAGNIPNQPVYTEGRPCSLCHEGTSCTIDYPGLCGSNGDEMQKYTRSALWKELEETATLKFVDFDGGEDKMRFNAYIFIIFIFID